MKKDIDLINSEELAVLNPWDRSFWLSRAFLEASGVLCTSLLEGEFSPQYSSSRVIFHLARQGIELFLKASIDAKEINTLKCGHNINELFLEYKRLYPEIDFNFNIPEQLLVNLNLDLFPETIEPLRTTLDQRHRYATDRHGRSFATPETFDPLLIRQKLDDLRGELVALEWGKIRPLLSGKNVA